MHIPPPTSPSSAAISNEVCECDYSLQNGVITFLKSLTNVVVEMTTEAFPSLTLKTKPFNVAVEK